MVISIFVDVISEKATFFSIYGQKSSLLSKKKVVFSVIFEKNTFIFFGVFGVIFKRQILLTQYIIVKNEQFWTLEIPQIIWVIGIMCITTFYDIFSGGGWD